MSNKDPNYKAKWAKKWRQDNPEKAKEYAKKDYLKHREKRIATSKKYYQEHRAERVAKKLESHKRAKLEVLAHYSVGETPKCVRCGIIDTDVLCVDHIEGGGNAHRRSLGQISGSHFYEWLRKNNFPKGYQTLCCNCNVKKRMVEGK